MIYVEPEHADSLFFPLNGDIYVIKNNKLVKDINSSQSGNIQPLATNTYKVTLTNGHSHVRTKKVLKGTVVGFRTYGPAELRKVVIRNNYTGATIAQLTAAEWGVGVAKTVNSTADYAFYVTNYSATTQTWNCEISF